MLRRFLCSTGILIVMGSASLNADSLAYQVTGGSQLGSLDLNTGVFTLIGTETAQLSGIGVAGGVLYGGGLGADKSLYRVDPTTGALTFVGDSGVAGVAYDNIGSTLSGLFAMGDNADLYSVNPSTGAWTLIGPTGLTLDNTDIGISTNSNTLYYANGSALYSLDTSTGAASLIGSTAPYFAGALVFEAGSLWAGADFPSPSVVTLNTTNGSPTFVANASNRAFFGLGPQTAATVPEPATLALVAGVMGFFAVLRLWSLRRDGRSL